MALKLRYETILLLKVSDYTSVSSEKIFRSSDHSPLLILLSSKETLSPLISFFMFFIAFQTKMRRRYDSPQKHYMQLAPSLLLFYFYSITIHSNLILRMRVCSWSQNEKDCASRSSSTIAYRYS